MRICLRQQRKGEFKGSHNAAENSGLVKTENSSGTVRDASGWISEDVGYSTNYFWNKVCRKSSFLENFHEL